MVGPKGWSQPCFQSLLSRPGFVPEPWCVGLDGSPEPVGGAHAVRGGHGCPCHWEVWLRFSGPGLGQDLRPNPVPTGAEPLVLGTSPVLLPQGPRHFRTSQWSFSFFLLVQNFALECQELFVLEHRPTTFPKGRRCVSCSVTPWTVARQAPLSMEFPR